MYRIVIGVSVAAVCVAVVVVTWELTNAYGEYDHSRPFFCLSPPLSLPFQMNQMCKVCGEPAAGFHFGAFTCEGCKVSVARHRAAALCV